MSEFNIFETKPAQEIKDKLSWHGFDRGLHDIVAALMMLCNTIAKLERENEALKRALKIETGGVIE